MYIGTRRLNLNTAKNMRDLGGYMRNDGKITKYGQFLRGDLIQFPDEKDMAFLKEFGLKTVIDLRTEGETRRRPNVFAGAEGINYKWLPLFGTVDTLPPDFGLPDLYMHMFESSENFGPLFNYMAQNPEGAIMYHCTSGKDRTGLVSALLLMLAGVDHQDIVADYEVSRTHIKQVFEEDLKRFPDIPIHFVQSQPEWIEAFINRVVGEYESAQNFLLEKGVAEENIKILTDKII